MRQVRRGAERLGEGEDMETGRGSNQARHVMLDGVVVGCLGEMKQRVEAA